MSGWAERSRVLNAHPELDFKDFAHCFTAKGDVFHTLLIDSRHSNRGSKYDLLSFLILAPANIFQL